MNNDPFFIAPERIHSIKSRWDNLMSIIVWGDIHSDQIGKVPRARKRLLEVGENFRSFISSKDWIAQPRQQLKSALGSSIKLRDSILALDSSCGSLISGADLPMFQIELNAFKAELMELIVEYENLWASHLDALGYDD